MTGRLWRASGVLALVGLIAASGARAQVGVPFHTVTVLPAVNQTGERRLGVWSLGWQYLIQERIRELNGIEVARFQDAPDLVEAFQAGKLDISTIAVRNQVAQALGADILIAPVMLKGPDEWEVRADVIEPATGPKPIAEIPATKGANALVVTDQIVGAALKAVLKVGDVPLPAYPPDPIDAREVEAVVYSLWLWPFCNPTEAKRGQLDKAFEQITRSATRPARFWMVHQRYLQIATAMGKGAEASSVVLRWATPLKLRDARAALLGGQANLAAGKDGEAKTWLVGAANLSKGAIPAVDAVAEWFRRQGNTAEALNQYESAAKLCPNVRPFRVKQGALALDSRAYDSAITAYRAAITLGPKQPDGYLGLTRALLAAKRPGEAFQTAQQLVALTPEDPAAKTLLVEAGLAAGEAAQVKEAAAQLAAARAEDAAAQALAGDVALAVEDYAAAEKAYAAAVKLDPKRVTSWRGLANARIYAPQPNYAGAIAALTAALKQAPDVERPDLQIELALASFYAQKYDDAVKTIREAATVLPNQPLPLYLEARFLLYKGDGKGAVEALAKALEKDPQAAGEGQQQIAYYEGEERDGHGFDHLKLGLAYLYQAAGRTREAKRQYTEFLGTTAGAPLSDWVKEQLALLDAAGTG